MQAKTPPRAPHTDELCAGAFTRPANCRAEVTTAWGASYAYAEFPVEIKVVAVNCYVYFIGSQDNFSLGNGALCCDMVPRLPQIPLQSQAGVLGKWGQWEM